MQNHFFIEPIEAYIWAEQIIENTDDKLIPCKILGVCTYVGEHMTAIIKLDNGVVYDYIPFTSLSWNLDGCVRNSCIYNCPSLEITVQKVPEEMREVFYTDKEKKIFVSGECLYMFDFYTSNELFLLIKSGDGGFVLRPLHKCLFRDKLGDAYTMDLSIYKKQRETYAEV